MKKKILMIAMIAVLVAGFVACGKSENGDSSKDSNEAAGKEDKSANELVEIAKSKEFKEKVVDKEWYRPITGCNERICFWEDGSYDYDEDCGYSLGKKSSYYAWEYNKENDNITIYGERDNTEEHIYESYTDTIEYISCDGDELVLIIEGEELIFTSEKPVVDQAEWDERHSLKVTYRSKMDEFMWGAMEQIWIQDDGSGNKILFTYNEETEREEFKYTTPSGESVSGFEKFDMFYFDESDYTVDENETENDLDEKMVLHLSNGNETKDIFFVGFIDDKLVLEIDGKEITFTREWSAY